MDTVERSSKKARVILAVLAILLLIAMLFSRQFFEWVGHWLSEDPNKTVQRFDIFVAWIAVFSLPPFFGGILMYRSGLRTVASERFPPIGMLVVVDTLVQTGSRARFRGRLLQLGGILMCALAIGLPIALWYIVHSVVSAI